MKNTHYDPYSYPDKIYCLQDNKQNGANTTHTFLRILSITFVWNSFSVVNIQWLAYQTLKKHTQMFIRSIHFCWLVLKKTDVCWQNTFHNLFSSSRFITWERQTWNLCIFATFTVNNPKVKVVEFDTCYHFTSLSKCKDDLSCYLQRHIWVLTA